MIVSVNWLKKFVDIDLPIDQLTTLIGARLVEIEQIIEIGEKYKDVLVAEIIEANKLEGTDHLNLAKINDGGVNKTVERDLDGYIQVVCGADNLRVGMLVAWLPPNSIVPESFNTKAPVILAAKELRGVTSNGMIASARELELGDGHDGIVDIPIEGAKAGDSFAELYELNDYLLDIENKSLTYRPDAFGVIGFAREVAGICDKQFQSPGWIKDVNPTIELTGEGIDAPKVVIGDPKLSDRYQGIIFSNSKDSKLTNELSIIESYIARSGIRSINPIVDITNYLMLMTGQPLHAFDYDKLLAISGDDVEIHVRLAKNGETLNLLDGRTIELNEEDIVVANSHRPLSLAGAMGGSDTEIDSGTKRVFLESATFNLYNLRSTQMRHGIFSEAITRFTKGQPAGLTAPVLAEASRLLKSSAGLDVISQVSQDYPGETDDSSIAISLEGINKVLGASLSVQDVVKSLGNVEFTVKVDQEDFEIKVPYWREDIHIPEDIIEEVGRMFGYDNIAPTLPTRDFMAILPSSFDKLRANIRQTLSRAGANEVLTYSFVHGDVLKKVGQAPNGSYKIINSISPELQYYRQSLTPSLLQLTHPNIKNGFDDFALFELNKTHPKHHGMTDENVPVEINSLAFTVASKNAKVGSPYYSAKNYIAFLGQSLGLDLIFEPLEDGSQDPASAPFEHRRSAAVIDGNSNQKIGLVGEYRRSVVRSFKLPDYTAGFEVDVDAILEAHLAVKNNYQSTSKYPSTERDICFQLNKDVPYVDILKSAIGYLETTNLDFGVEPVDIYELPEQDKKNVTIRINLTSKVKTLTGEEVSGVIDAVSDAVCKSVNASVV